MKGRDRVGNAMTWLSGGALAFNLLLVAGLIGVIGFHGARYFWQRGLVELTLVDGAKVLGEVHDNEIARVVDATGGVTEIPRVQLKVGNREVSGADFVWIDESEVAARETRKDAMVLERLEWGNFYGYPVELRRGDRVDVSGAAAVAKALPAVIAQKTDERETIAELAEGPIGDVNRELELLRLEQRDLVRAGGEDSSKMASLESRAEEAERRYDALATELFALREDLLRDVLVMETADGERREIVLGNIVRAIQPNSLGTAAKLRLYASRVREFIFDDPRESNTEGGIFPAIFGTVMMVFLMTIVVVPFGVLGALFLREYAKQGWMVRVVRIAVNNLAGVPSIVFGVFGLGFFVYWMGGTIDSLFYSSNLPTPTFGTGGILWASLTLALLTVPVVVVATEEGLAAVPRSMREGSIALGATKWETTWRVVLPGAMPGILTGVILAMARAAGEVAPLMIVGMVKLAPALPVDRYAPFVHLERKFMHLGFHIYDVGFQSPNVEAAKPLVFATAFLLIVIVTLMNLSAITLRNKLRARSGSSGV